MYNSPYKRIPVDINTYIIDDDYLGLSSKVYNKVEIDLDCLFRPDYDFSYTERYFIDEPGTGKSWRIHIAMCYMIYLLTCLKDPVRYFRLGKGLMISLVYITVNMNSSKHHVFSQIAPWLCKQAWFKEVNDKTMHHSLCFPDLNVEIVPCGLDLSKLKGKNILCAAIDDVDWMASSTGSRYVKENISARFNRKGLFMVAG